MFECDIITWNNVIRRVKSFVEALINMVCELKITSWTIKNKNSSVIRHSIKELLAKNSVTRSMKYTVVLLNT